MISDIIEIKAKLTLYSTENGGRKTGIKTGYRPNHVFEHKNDEFLSTYIGQIDFDKESIMPNETANVSVKFLNHGDIKNLLIIGRVWWIYEVPRKIGEAEIIEIITE